MKKINISTFNGFPWSDRGFVDICYKPVDNQPNGVDCQGSVYEYELAGRIVRRCTSCNKYHKTKPEH